MDIQSSKKSLKLYAILLRLLGLTALLLAAVLNRDRAGDWFFRSGIFTESFAPALTALRVALAVLGASLLALAPLFGNRFQSWWSRLTVFQRTSLQVAVMVMIVTAIYALSVYFRENLILLEQISRHRTRYRMLGFDVVLQDNPLLTADFFTCIFLGMAAILSYTIHSLRRLDIISENGNRRHHPGFIWLILAAGFFFAATDEYFGIHEFIGDNIIKRCDSVVMIAYAVLAVVVLSRYVRYLASFKPGMYMFGLGVSAQIAAMVLDRIAVSAFMEEGLEMLGSVFYMGGTALYLAWEVLLSK